MCRFYGAGAANFTLESIRASVVAQNLYVGPSLGRALFHRWAEDTADITCAHAFFFGENYPNVSSQGWPISGNVNDSLSDDDVKVYTVDPDEFTYEDLVRQLTERQLAIASAAITSTIMSVVQPFPKYQ